MKINVYKDESLFISFTGKNNPLAIFFINKESIIDYKINPDLSAEDRHDLRYSFNEKDYLVNINSNMAEAVLNNYRTELVDE
jgi:hypothetical protein